MTSLASLRAALGGEISGGQVLAPGPGHSPRDRSLAVRPMADGLLIHSHAGDDWRACKAYVEDRLGYQTQPPRDRTLVRPSRENIARDAERTARAVSLWTHATAWPESPVETYLRSRSLDPSWLEPAGDVRFLADCPFGETTTPAMVCLVRDVVTDEPIAIHRTALSPTGAKVKINGRDRMALGPIAGGCIKLTPDAEVSICLGVAEGVETAMSMRALREFGPSPVWAAISAGNLARFPLLGGIEALWVGVDHDPAGEAAANACCARYYEAGVEAFFIRADRRGSDLNDILDAA